MTDHQPSVEEFAAEARAWLTQHAPVATASPTGDLVWGEGQFSVTVFHSITDEQERALFDDARAWNQKRAEKGYHAIKWPREYGGLGLSAEHARVYGEAEREFATAKRHETFNVTTGLIAPTVERFGTEEQKERFVGAFLRTDLYCCQLFSEPGAGSDLATLACRAELDGDEWVINGQKVWSSGARFSEWGELIARTDPDAPKHKGMTAFLVPLDLPGIEIRPIEQMNGGASFNEVFFTDVRIPDNLRLGPIGDGWNVALTTLAFERDHTAGGGNSSRPGGNWRQLVATAKALGTTQDANIRQSLMRVYSHVMIESWLLRRAADNRAAGAPPGAEGSLGKLHWTEGMTLMSQVVSEVLGPRLMADTGEWGTYAWNEHVLGAPGYRIAGGSDEVQRNIIGERVLGLPPEPRTDKNTPWKTIPR